MRGLLQGQGASLFSVLLAVRLAYYASSISRGTLLQRKRSYSRGDPGAVVRI